MKQKTQIWLPFITINILCWLTYRYLYENGEKGKLSRIVGYMLDFLWLVLVGLIGNIAWKRAKPAWIRGIWLYAYVGVTLILVFFGLIDRLIGGFPMNIRDGLAYTRVFFTTPMPFALCWFLYSIYGKKEVSAKRML